MQKAQGYKAQNNNLDDNDIAIIKKICSLSSILQTIEKNHETHLLTYYTLELAKAFHTYYAHQGVEELAEVYKAPTPEPTSMPEVMHTGMGKMMQGHDMSPDQIHAMMKERGINPEEMHTMMGKEGFNPKKMRERMKEKGTD